MRGASKIHDNHRHSAIITFVLDVAHATALIIDPDRISPRVHTGGRIASDEQQATIVSASLTALLITFFGHVDALPR